MIPVLTSQSPAVVNRFVTLSLLICITASASAQYLLHGQVFDDQANKPLPGATVFIANTTKGTSTDADGKFQIGGLYDIHYSVVISFVGYEPIVADMTPSVIYQVRLKPAVKVLNEVVVRARSMSRAQWRGYLKNFKEHFIGLSVNSWHCVIENEGVLSFEREKGILTATADTTLIMRNDGLGYRVKILLQKYEFNSQVGSVRYEGQMSYEPLIPSGDKQKKQWAENRLTAYYGSQMHFFRALYSRRLNEEGFYFSLNDQLGNDSLVSVISHALYNSKLELRTIKDYNKIVYKTPAIQGGQVLTFRNTLTVSYINELEDYRYQQHRNIGSRRAIQQSLLKSRQPAYLFPDGRIYPIDAAETQGYWSWELMAEALPLDYGPEVDLQELGRNH